MKKVLIGIILILSIGMTGCLSKTEESNSAANKSEIAEYDSTDNASTIDIYDADNGIRDESNTSGVSVLESERKIVKSGQLNLQTTKFNEVITSLEAMVKDYQGYIASSSIDSEGISDNYKTLKFASYKIDVPSDKLEDFLEESSNLATVINKSTSAEDITDKYYDNESRLKSLKIQEERYLEILQNATEVKDVVEIENALTDVRYQIENLTTYLNKMNSLVEMSTVYININEVSEETVAKTVPKTLGEKISNSFVNSLKEIKELAVNIFIFIIAAIPYLIIIAIIIVLILKIRKVIKKRKENKEK